MYVHIRAVDSSEHQVLNVTIMKILSMNFSTVVMIGWDMTVIWQVNGECQIKEVKIY